VEIADYLRVARRSLWVLIVVPFGAALLAAVFVLVSPATYQATATVDLPLGNGKSPYAGSHGQVLYVDDFRTEATSGPVVASVAARTGANAKTLPTKLQIKQVGNSSVMSVTYPAPTKAQAAAVVDAVAVATLDRILQTQANAAKPTLAVAIDARRPLLERQSELTQKAGGVPPDKAIRTVQMEINSLKRQQRNLQARGNNPGALAAVGQELAAAQTRLAAYRPMALEYSTLKTELTSANQNVTKQSQVVQAITGLQQTAKAPGTITVAPAKRQPRVSKVMTAAVAAAGAGAFLALGIITIMELLARRRRVRADSQGVDTAAAPRTATSNGHVEDRDADGSATSKVSTSADASRRPWQRSAAVPTGNGGGDSPADDLGAGPQQPAGIRLPLKPK